jgi:hypothetical protein
LAQSGRFACERLTPCARPRPAQPNQLELGQRANASVIERLEAWASFANCIERVQQTSHRARQAICIKPAAKSQVNVNIERCAGYVIDLREPHDPSAAKLVNGTVIDAKPE